ncbi:MAG: hypothetical protein KDB02_02930, partial [Acidimicrobiales bacterium]|nr:hypothetical protein [Acidimicrobiales bacterium]
MIPAAVAPSAAVEPSWRSDVRADAVRWLADHRPPTTRDELWRYSDVDALLEAMAADPADDQVDVDAPTIARLAGDGPANRLVLVNGRPIADLASRDGDTDVVEVLSLRPSDHRCPA